MGQKVHPHGLRVGVIKDWDSKWYANKKDFGDGAVYYFEGIPFKGPVNYDAVLKTIYGDYMKLPPVEKRISYHTSDAYWK